MLGCYELARARACQEIHLRELRPCHGARECVVLPRPCSIVPVSTLQQYPDVTFTS